MNHLKFSSIVDTIVSVLPFDKYKAVPKKEKQRSYEVKLNKTGARA